MEKLTFEEWKNSMSFVIDDEFDNNFLLSIEPLTKYINQKCHQFSDYGQLSSFLTTNDTFSALEKLKAFVSLIGLSEERLKRVVSLLRYRFNSEEFRSEWDVKKISRALQTDEAFRDRLIDFFLEGRNSLVGAEIPLYYMRNFKLNDRRFISNLKDYEYVERILNDNEIQGKYSNRVGAHVESIIKNRLENYRINENPKLQYEIQKEFPLLNKNIDFLIPNLDKPEPNRNTCNFTEWNY